MGKTQNSELFKSSSGSKIKVRVGSGSGYSSKPAPKASKPMKSLVLVIRPEDPLYDYDSGDGHDGDEDCMYSPHIEQMQPKPSAADGHASITTADLFLAMMMMMSIMTIATMKILAMIMVMMIILQKQFKQKAGCILITCSTLISAFVPIVKEPCTQF